MKEQADYVPKHPLDHDALQAMFARSDKTLMEQGEAERRLQEWPLRVQQTLDELRGQVALLRERVEQLERGQG